MARNTSTPTLPQVNSRQRDILNEMARAPKRWIYGDTCRSVADHNAIVDDISRLRAKGWGFEERVINPTTGQRAYRPDQQRWPRQKAALSR